MATLPTLRRRGSRITYPWPSWDILEDQMNRFLEGVTPSEAAGEAFVWAPRVDFGEQDGKYVLTAEIPGVDSKDVQVEVEGNVLSIRGEKRIERKREDERLRLAERRYGSFERSMTLPSTADPGQVQADFHQGVLTVEIGKRPEAQGRKIEVRAK